MFSWDWTPNPAPSPVYTQDFSNHIWGLFLGNMEDTGTERSGMADGHLPRLPTLYPLLQGSRAGPRAGCWVPGPGDRAPH